MSCDTGLLDPAVTGLLGPVDHETSCAITPICHDALRAVLEAGLAAAAIGDPGFWPGRRRGPGTWRAGCSSRP